MSCPTGMNDITAYLEYITAQKGLASASLKAYSRDLMLFRDYLLLENLKINRLERSHFRGFMAELNYKKFDHSSINRILSGIKSYIRFRIRSGYEDTASIMEVES